MKSFRGQFLVAAPHQLDPNFFQTVILVVKHTGPGALGLIINRRSEQSGRIVGNYHPQQLCSRKAKTYFGGPVTGPLMAVHTKRSLAEIDLLPGLFFSAEEENVLALMWQNQQPYRVFFGYAGWGPEQLDHEVERGIWQVVPGTPEQIFSDSGDLWQQLSQSRAPLAKRRVIFDCKHITADPLLN